METTRDVAQARERRQLERRRRRLGRERAADCADVRETRRDVRDVLQRLRRGDARGGLGAPLRDLAPRRRGEFERLEARRA